MSETLYYVNDFTDEVMPVSSATLEAWAEWLAQPAPEWNRAAGFESGAMFAISVASVVEIDCVSTADGWRYDRSLDATGPHDLNGPAYFLRNGSGGGWWPENSGNTIAEALASEDDLAIGETAYVARLTWTGDVSAQLDLSGPSPALRIVTAAGHA